MAVVRMRGALLDALIKARGGIGAFLGEWSEQDRNVPDKGTVYRWINGETVPRGADDYLRLCAVLDVDPVVLLEAELDDAAGAIEHLLSAVQIGKWPQGWLQFLADFFGRQKLWPPPGLAKAHYGRDWHVVELRHDPAVRANYYATIALAGAGNVYPTRPQVIHVAFRIPGFFHERWLEFGAVQRFGAEVGLFHINGHNETQEAQVAAPALVETWFGPGPAVFRLASIHHFTATLVEGVEGPRVRFPG